CFRFFFQAEDGIRDFHVTGVQTCALPICGGYKTPSLKQADDNIVEPAARGRSWDKGNSNLQPEKSTNFEFGFAYATPEKLSFSRSEERRVGKEGRSRGSEDHEEKRQTRRG